MMRACGYISTRGKSEALSFEQVLLEGLATDGGLYLPDFSDEEYERLVDIKSLKNLAYNELAYRVMLPFVRGSLNITEEDLRQICDETYVNFDHKAIAPLKQFDKNLWGLELFYGPTLAFKDYALQMVGRLFDLVLSKRKENLTIVGATSGDTGPAAIYAIKDKENAKIFMLHPYGKVSDVQRKQMVTIDAKNVYNLAVKGDFDDCQAIVKSLFNDREFNKKVNLGAVNSINFARILAQVVYYFYAGISIGGDKKEINFAVPTGNFGNVFAGFLARKMGLKIKYLIIGSNPNDVLPRFMETGKMARKETLSSLSPSMDIQVSSNFERLLYLSLNKDGKLLEEKMKEFGSKGIYSVDEKTLSEITSIFKAEGVSDEETLESIRDVYNETNEIVDPHSAIALRVARKYSKETPTIAVLTAHPAKFKDAVKKAIDRDIVFPETLNKILKLPERYDIIANDVLEAKDYILKKL